MKRINFSAVPCWTDIKKEDKILTDIKYQFSDAMYKHGNGIAMGALAMKIYNSQGETEYTDEEVNTILRFASSVNPIVFDSLKALVESKDNKPVEE